MKIITVMPEDVTLPMDQYPHIEFSVTTAAVTQNKCIMCGLDISPRSRTCSPNCRKRASRRKEAMRRELLNVQDALRALERYSQRWPDLQRDIQKTLNECVTAATVTYFDVTAAGDGLR
jgi:predicted nucleic acid-binding Zn ribbon protein